MKQVAKTGSATPPRKGKSGRKRKTSLREDIFVMRQSKLDLGKTSFNLLRDLALTETEITASAVRKRLITGGRKIIRPAKKQLLTDTMKKKRYEWVKKHKTWTIDHWKNAMFTDKSHFFVGSKHSQFVRKSTGERLLAAHINQSVKNPKKKMLWESFTWKSVWSVIPVEGMMNIDRYINVLTRKAFPDLKKMFPNGKGIFQQDLAPCHSSKEEEKKKKHYSFCEKKAQVVEWPENSPDINPIANLWQ